MSESPCGPTAVCPVTAEYPDSVGVHQLFESQVRRSPESIAATDGDDALTYRALNARANEFARSLLANGVGAGHVVALLLDRSLPCLVALLGVLKSGAAYVPLDTALPTKLLAYILSDSGASCLVTDSATRALLEDIDTSALVVVDADGPPTRPGDDTDLNLPVDPDALVYSIYTSGSTGVPKGVMVHHRGLTNYICWARKQYLSPGIECFALYSSLAFDLTVTSIFVPLVAGASIRVYADQGDDAHILGRVVAEGRADFLKLTPAHLELIGPSALAGSRLEVLVLGGEQLEVRLAAAAHEALGGRVAIYNEYGPTEAVVGCMVHRYDPTTDLQGGGAVPIGVGIDNTRIYLLDQALRPVERGAVGQIHVGGDGVTLGYKGIPEKTAAQFIADPFSRPGERLYATGDLARVDDRGEVVFLRRMDLQVKLNGYRVELDGVENVLRDHPDVEDCVAASSAMTTHGADERRSYCVRCGLASNFPNTHFTPQGVCNHCQAFASYRSVVDAYFGEMDDLRAIVDDMKRRCHPQYDCVVSLSGGKDSTYALCRMVELGARVLAFTLDNGYLSSGAKENIDRAVSRLGVAHRYVSTPHMNAIFVDSLKRHSNVCNGCFKTIYTFAINLAHEVGLEHVVMGLSKGQLFETRLPALFRASTYDDDVFEQSLVDARKIYHRIDDAANRLLDTSCVHDEAIIESIRFVDFYRYCHVSRERMCEHIEERVGWKRPNDTGRSTNCLLNDVGIYVHNAERRYHNYSLPYSWDVRMGHISRDEALTELDDERIIDVESVEALLQELGYAMNHSGGEGRAGAQLVAYYVSNRAIPANALRRFVGERLPAYMVPSAFVRLDSIPLTPNGKVNRRALPRPDVRAPAAASTASEPMTPVQTKLAELWKEALDIEEVGVHDDFFELGGHSLPALMLLFKIDRHFGTVISIAEFSNVPTISGLSSLLERAGAASGSDQ